MQPKLRKKKVLPKLQPRLYGAFSLASLRRPGNQALLAPRSDADERKDSVSPLPSSRSLAAANLALKFGELRANKPPTQRKPPARKPSTSVAIPSALDARKPSAATVPAAALPEAFCADVDP